MVGLGGGKGSDGGRGHTEGSRRLRLRFVGEVQGVGFRWTCRMIAGELGLSGWVRNEDDGSVTLELQGGAELMPVFFTRLVESYRLHPIHYSIDSREDLPLDPHEQGFSVRYY